MAALRSVLVAASTRTLAWTGRDLRLARARSAGDQDADVERRHERGQAQHLGQRLAAADHALGAEELAKGARRIRVVAAAALEEQAIDEGDHVAREALGVAAV